MKKIVKLIIFAVFITNCQLAEAQFLKKLKKKAQDKITEVENKVIDKVENKADKEIDDVLNGDKNSKKEKKEEPKDILTIEASGSAIIQHTQKYGNYNIEKFGRANLQRSNDEVRIYGSWLTQAADIQDGYVLVIPKGNTLLFEDELPIKERLVLKIPEDASLELSYDPVWEPNQETEDGFYRAHSLDYQSYDLDAGEVSIDVISEDNFQISFSGVTELVTRQKNPNQNSEDKYVLSYTESKIKGAIDVGPVYFIDRRTVSKNKSKKPEAPSLANLPSETANSGVYKFTFETVVKMTNSENNETYKLSYLLNPNENYIAIKADMSDYSDEEMAGESIIVMDNGNSYIFVETNGMKMKMSQNMMGGQQMTNPSEQMANYDYSKIKKTGRSKTVLGATCYEYVMSDANVKMELWVAPDVNLPNWFIQNNDIINGHIMAYNVKSKEGNMSSETIAINDNISKTINPKDYKKMF